MCFDCFHFKSLCCIGYQVKENMIVEHKKEKKKLEKVVCIDPIKDFPGKTLTYLLKSKGLN